MPSPNVPPTAIRFWPELKEPIQAIVDEHQLTFHAVVLHLVKIGLDTPVDWPTSGLRPVKAKVAREAKAAGPKSTKRINPLDRAAATALEAEIPRAEKAEKVAKAKPAPQPPAKPKGIDDTRYREFMAAQEAAKQPKVRKAK